MAEKKKDTRFSSTYQPDYEKRRKRQIESGEQRRAFKEIFNALLNNDYSDAKGEKLSGKQMLAMRVFKTALQDGNLEAFKIIRDTIGEKPIEKIAVSTVSEEKISEIENMIEETENKSVKNETKRNGKTKNN